MLHGDDVDVYYMSIDIIPPLASENVARLSPLHPLRILSRSRSTSFSPRRPAHLLISASANISARYRKTRRGRERKKKRKGKEGRSEGKDRTKKKRMDAAVIGERITMRKKRKRKDGETQERREERQTTTKWKRGWPIAGRGEPFGFVSTG